MEKLIVLKLDGDCEEGVRVTLEIGLEGERPETEVIGWLPPASDITQKYREWQLTYRSLAKETRAITGRRARIDGSLKKGKQECRTLANDLKNRLNSWLKSESFLAIREKWLAKVSVSDTVRVMIRSENQELFLLPWHQWDLLELYNQAEIGLSTLEYEKLPVTPNINNLDYIKILAILGNSEEINLEKDRELLENLPGAKTTFLVEPKRLELNDQLWEEHWDILFFAGHSKTEGEKGRLYINQTDSFTLDEVKYALKKAVASGLQLAIFNSCDGLGLARELEGLHIPQMIVMGEPVPDRVAQGFLKYFLSAFAKGKSLYLAVQEARQRLQGWEDEFPCASWLPVIWQNPAEIPLTWEDLYAKPQVEIDIILPVSPSKVSRFHWRSIKPVLFASLVTTGLVMGVRWLGFLESWELSAYDKLMRSRQPEFLDSRLLVIEITKEETDKYLYPVKDSKIVELIKQLEEYKPLAIGLDIHRYQPRLEPNESQSRENFIELFERNNNLFAVCAYDTTDKDLYPPSEFSQKQLKYQVGFSNLSIDGELNSDNSTVRRQQLSYDPNLSSFSSPCITPYSLGFHLAYRFLDLKGIKPLAITDNKEWQFGQAIFKQLATRTGGYQNLEKGISQILLNYRSPDRSGQIAKKVSLTQLLEKKVDPKQIEGRIVLIGYTAPRAEDYFNTPYGKMAGVWIHAHIVSQLISTALGERSLLWVLPQWGDFQWGDGLFIWFWSLIGGVLAWLIRSSLHLILASGITILVLSQICLIVLNQGGWMPLIPSGISLLASGVLVICINYKNRQKLHQNQLS